MQRASKFELQCQIYTELKKNGFSVRGGVKIPGFYEYEADLVLFNEDKKPYLVIEVKNSIRAMSTKRVKRLSKYLDSPWLQIRGAEEVLNCIELVQRRLKKYGGGHEVRQI